MPHKDEAGSFQSRFSCVAGDLTPGGLRLDRYAAEVLRLLSRSQTKSRNLRALVNGREVKISRLLYGGEKLELSWKDPDPLCLIPEDIPLEIVYEDERVAVINKAQGMVVHPGAGNRRGTLANALYFRRLCRNIAEPADGSTRPGIVHRLDKDTSGLIITAWDEAAHEFLAAQFKERRVIKTYGAVVQGCPKEKQGAINLPIHRDSRDRKRFTVNPAGKPSVTFYKVVKSWGVYSLLLLRPKTGRTHQIRVHLKHLGYPILGDPLYGRPDRLFPNLSLMLHSKRLSLVLPGKGKRTFRTSFPERFTELFSALNKI